MASERKANPRQLCPVQAACDGVWISVGLASCRRCERALMQRAKMREEKPLRGEKYCETYFKEQ